MFTAKRDYELEIAEFCDYIKSWKNINSENAVEIGRKVFKLSSSLFNAGFLADKEVKEKRRYEKIISIVINRIIEQYDVFNISAEQFKEAVMIILYYACRGSRASGIEVNLVRVFDLIKNQKASNAQELEWSFGAFKWCLENCNQVNGIDDIQIGYIDKIISENFANFLLNAKETDLNNLIFTSDTIRSAFWFKKLCDELQFSARIYSKSTYKWFEKIAAC